MGQVQVRIMTDEERLAYIEKHPIKERRKNKGIADYKWRGKKAAESRWGKNKQSNYLIL